MARQKETIKQAKKRAGNKANSAKDKKKAAKKAEQKNKRAAELKRTRDNTAKTKRAKLRSGHPDSTQHQTILVPIELLGIRVDETQRQDKPEEKRAKRKSKRKSSAQRAILHKDKPRDERGSSRGALSIFAACVSLALVLVAGYFAFLIDTVDIEGNQRYSDELITELSGIYAGTHILLADLNKATANIESTPYIKVLSAERVFPRGIKFTIMERDEAALIQSQPYGVIIDVQGHVLTIGETSNTSGLLRVVGMSAHGYQVNKPIGSGGDVQAAALTSIMSCLSELSLMNSVDELNMSNPLRVSMKTKEGIDVLLGQADNLEEKLQWMKEALPSLKISGIDSGILDVGAKGGPVYSPVVSRAYSNNNQAQNEEKIKNNESENNEENELENNGENSQTTEPETFFEGEGEG